MFQKKIVSLCIVILLIFLTSCGNKQDDNLMEPSTLIADDLSSIASNETTTATDDTQHTSEEAINEIPFSETQHYPIYPIFLDGYVEYIDQYANIITDYKFDKGGYMCDGLAIVTKDGLYGAIDSTGNFNVPLQYYEMSNYSCGLAKAKNAEDEYGFVDTAGNIIIPFEYEKAQSFSENIAIAFKDDEVFFFDIKGNILFQEKGSNFSPYYWGDFHNGLVVNGNAYYNVNGERVIKNNITDNLAEGWYPGNFSNGYAVYPQIKEEYYPQYYYTDERVQQFFNGENWYYIYINEIGENIFEKEFELAGSFSEGLAVAKMNGMTGCIDLTGNFIYYNDMVYGEYSEGAITFYTCNANEYKFGFLDRTGNVIIPAIYDEVVNVFNNGLALVQIDSELRYINYSGDVVFSFNKPNHSWLMF